MSVSFDVNEAGSGLCFGFTKARDYGTFELYLDDVKIGDAVDLYDPQVVHFEHKTLVKIKAGTHTLKFKCIGKNGRSTRYFFG